MKIKNGENKRNRIDIILTDLQPVETPEIYTMKFFYNYLLERKSIKKICKKERDAEKGITCPSWHAAPLKYRTLKDNNEYREMSYVNPLSMIEICIFLDEYEKLLLDYLNKESFSIRKHKRRDNLLFKQTQDGKVEYGYKSIIDREATGDFYEIYPFSRLDLFYKSIEWFDLNRRYKYFGKLDYSKCFDSIYTHTYNWLIADNTIDAKEFNKNHFLSATDRLLQNMNMSITNGIIVGPEFCRFLAEIILQAIDRDVINELKSEGYIREETYEIKRYVDDMFIFADKEEDIQQIIEEVTRAAEKFKLKINHEKKIIGKLPHIWSEWISNISEFQKYMIDSMFYSLLDQEHSYLLKERNVSSVGKMAKIKELFQNVIISDEKMNVKIVSYCLSTIYNKLKTQRNNEVKKSIFNMGNDSVVYCFFDLLFYFFSFAPTYKNTEKVISIIHVIEKEIGERKSTENLVKIIGRYNYIFYNGNFSDITNLLLMCTIKKIDIGRIAEEKCKKMIEKENNPMHYAIWLLYDQNVAQGKMAIKTDIENIICQKLDILKMMGNNLFLNPDLWWIFIFFGCPYLIQSSQDEMEDFLKSSKASFSIDSVWGASKIEVIEFYLCNKYSNKLIDWKIDKDTFYKNIVFKTFERTIFNNGGGDDLAAVFEYV